ncbi:MAG TPA: cytochrome b N-terminal domain-containing protein [Fimbriimonadaceae bacterium]|nr:cytochrome b N-terminal domain-containing protein [Fimbriimonadaceae bacterium]
MKATGTGTTTQRILSASATALVLEFVFQCLAGWYLNRAYIPDPKHAHDTMQAIMSASPHAQIAGFHYWGSAFFIVHSFFHLCLMLFSGNFRAPNHWCWYSALALFGAAFLFQLTGNLLPFDQHGVQTAAVEGGITAGVPGGKAIAAVMMGGEPSVTDQTLPVWYTAHRLILPIALLIGLLGATGMQLRRENAGKAYWIPATIVALIPLGVALVVQRPLGTGATEVDYNRFNAMVSWYTWPLHGSLEAFNNVSPTLGWIGSAAIPGLFVLFLLAAPILAKRLATSGIQFIFILFMAYFIGTGAIFGGGFAPLTGTRDPDQSSYVADNTQKEPATPIDEEIAKQGKVLFEDEGCSGCHEIDGVKATGGPKLDDIYRLHTDPKWYVDFIKNPKSVKKNSTMPAYPDLPEQNLRAMAEFLRKPRH